MDFVYTDKSKCSGCSLCEFMCPKSAVSMDFTQFSYPKIDSNKCIDCGLCRKKCPFANKKEEESNCLKAYAVKHKTKDVIENSSSGGVFTALSDYFLNNNGVIYGADFDKNMTVHHTRAATVRERDRLRGSKYVQSDMLGIFKKIQADLNNGKKVLFTGTPCQASAVRTAFPKSENLYIIDIICHGVPSPMLWQQYVDFIENKYKKKLSYYSFRDKEQNGWRQYSAKLTFQDGDILTHSNVTGSFIELFRYDVALRPSCTECIYTSPHRIGDITIGDFWGIENVLPEFDDNSGISAVMVNTTKGECLFNSILDDITAIECKQSDIADKQPNLSKPSSYSNIATAFNNDWKILPFEDVLKKYTRVGAKRRIKDLAKKVLNK